MKKLIFGKIINSNEFDTLIESHFDEKDLEDFYKPRFNLHSTLYSFKNKNVKISCLISKNLNSGIQEFKKGNYKTIEGLIKISKDTVYGDRSITINKYNLGKLLNKEEGNFVFLKVET